MQQDLLTVRETCQYLRLGKNRVYELIAEGRIPHVRLGRSIRIPRQALESWLAREADKAAV